jgi:type IV secretory pathway TrbD component
MAAVSTRHQVHHVLHRPMLWCGVERRLFVIAAGLGFLTWNLTLSFPGGILVFATLYAGAYWSTQRDPQMLQILMKVYIGPHRQGVRLRTTFDPLKCVPVRINVLR